MKVLQIDIDQGESGLFYATAPKSNTGLLVVGDSIGHVLNKIPIAWEELQQVRRQFEGGRIGLRPLHLGAEGMQEK